MKKQATIIICAIIAAMSITALCSENILINFEDATDCTFEFATERKNIIEVEESIQLIEPVISLGEADTFIDEIDTHITLNNFEDTDRKRIENKFISTLSEYRMTSEELKYINTLTHDDYDIEVILDIYEFLRWSNVDMSMITDIYHAGKENRDKKFWIYDAYDSLLCRTDDILSVEDVAYYVGLGLSVDEIAGAYELSFAGTKTTKQMLSERIDGATWNEISAEILSTNPQVIKDAPEMTIDDVMTCRRHSVRMRKDVADIFTVRDDKFTLTEEAVTNERAMQKAKYDFIEKYNAEMPVPEQKQTVDYTTNSNIMTFNNENNEHMFEEDYIPLEEPEVE